MLTLVDEDIPGGSSTFAVLGDVRTFPGRSLRSSDLAGADALIARSVTRVDEGLLAGSSVRFVGSVTSGTDHIDTAWLDRHGIAFASAAGANSNAVSEYVLAALLRLAVDLDFDPRQRTIGIVGVGRIGSRVARWARALGMSVLLCDPPLGRETGDPAYLDSADLAGQADIITLHVPLTDSGPDATRDLVDEQWLARLKPGAMFVNTSRGGVVREDHLRAAIDRGRLAAVVLDVWRHEPSVDPALVDRAMIATPHIAGYSVEARTRAVAMIAAALAKFAGVSSSSPVAGGRLVPLDAGSINAAAGGTPSDPAWRQVAAVTAHVCDLSVLDQRFRQAVSSVEPAWGFDAVREAAAARQEFGAFRIRTESEAPEVIRLLSAFGFLTRP